MTTKLEKELRREIDIGGKPYTVTLSPDGMRLTEKGRKKGHELRWQDWVSGEAALAIALNASLSKAASLAYKSPSYKPNTERPKGSEPTTPKRSSKKHPESARSSSRNK